MLAGGLRFGGRCMGTTGFATHHNLGAWGSDGLHAWYGMRRHRLNQAGRKLYHGALANSLFGTLHIYFPASDLNANSIQGARA